MLLKHVYMGSKFWRTLKLGMSFSLEHFFIALPISTQVASVPLTSVDFPMKLDLYLKDVELFVETLSGFPSFVTGDSSLLNYHKLPEASE